MTPSNALNERDALRGQVRFLRVTLIGALAAILALIALNGFLVLNEKTAIVPPEVRRPYELGANYANKEYLLDMASYVLDQVLTVTPETVDFNNKKILRMTHPDGYGALKTTLDAAAQRLKQERVTTVWIPRSERVNEQAKLVEVTGQLKTFIADKLTSQRDKSYLIEFTITTSGRLYVSRIEEVVKRDPAADKPAQP